MLNNKSTTLDRFSSRHITPSYMEWVNDYDVNKYVEMGRIPVFKSEVFVPDSNKTIMFAIIENNAYVGTASIHNIDWINRKAEIGYMVGDKSVWGYGVGTRAVGILCNYAFNQLGLNKLTANVVTENRGSVKILEKNGFTQAGKMPMDYYRDGQWFDSLSFFKIHEP